MGWFSNCLYLYIDLCVCGKKASSRQRKKIFISDLGCFLGNIECRPFQAELTDQEPDRICFIIKDPCVCTFIHTCTHREPKIRSRLWIWLSLYRKKKNNKLGTGEHIGNTMQAQPAKSKLWKTASDLVSLANKLQRK